MNHIRRLQTELADANARLAAALAELDDFRFHLHLPKFVGEENGERKDWIAVGDVLRRIDLIERAAHNG